MGCHYHKVKLYLCWLILSSFDSGMESFGSAIKRDIGLKEFVLIGMETYESFFSSNLESLFVISSNIFINILFFFSIWSLMLGGSLTLPLQLLDILLSLFSFC